MLTAGKVADIWVRSFQHFPAGLYADPTAMVPGRRNLWSDSGPALLLVRSDSEHLGFVPTNAQGGLPRRRRSHRRRDRIRQ